MSANVVFQPVSQTRWLAGLTNLMRYESDRWWRRGRWLLHLVLWLVLVNGLLAAFLWAPIEELAEAAIESEGSDTPIELIDPLTGGIILFLLMGGLTTGTGVILVMQGAVVDEKKRGTAAWILSKPVSRSAFLLSRLIVNGMAMLLLMVVAQGLVAYVLLSTRTGAALPILPFLFGLGLFGLHLLFYLTLTLMLGTVFEDRGPVIGIPLAILYGSQVVQGTFPWLSLLLPWEILLPGQQNSPALAMQAMLGQPLSTYTPIIATALWIPFFIVIAIWKFRRDEF